MIILEKRKCAASDCDNNIDGMMSHALYCSVQCRWREHKRKTYEKRISKGKCPQCGNEMDSPTSSHKKSPSYCSKCQEYYHKKYLNRKNDQAHKFL